MKIIPHLQVHDGGDGHDGTTNKDTSNFNLSSSTGVCWRDNWIGWGGIVLIWIHWSVSWGVDWDMGNQSAWDFSWCLISDSPSLISSLGVESNSGLESDGTIGFDTDWVGGWLWLWNGDSRVVSMDTGRDNGGIWWNWVVNGGKLVGWVGWSGLWVRDTVAWDCDGLGNVLGVSLFLASIAWLGHNLGIIHSSGSDV